MYDKGCYCLWYVQVRGHFYVREELEEMEWAGALGGRASRASTDIDDVDDRRLMIAVTLCKMIA